MPSNPDNSAPRTPPGLRERLRAMRTEHGLTQAELAAKLHTKQSVISRRERGELGISINDALDWAEACDHRASLLFTDPDILPPDWLDDLEALAPNELSRRLSILALLFRMPVESREAVMAVFDRLLAVHLDDQQAAWAIRRLATAARSDPNPEQ